jgi:hypothetical protein
MTVEVTRADRLAAVREIIAKNRRKNAAQILTPSAREIDDYYANLAGLPAPDHASALAEVLKGFVLDLTNSLRNRETMLTINHVMLVKRIEQARATLTAYHASKEQTDG